MLYHVLSLTAVPGREAEALRLLKQLAEHSNRINPRAVVEIHQQVGGPTGEYLWVGKLASREDHDAGGTVFRADSQTQALMKELEQEFQSVVPELHERFYTVM